MIIVTGASGQLGHAIVEQLVRRVPPECVGVSVRDESKVADLSALGVRVRRADFDEPDSVRHAFQNAQQVLIVSSNARAFGADPLVQHRTAIEAARAAGARRVLYTSHMAASDTSSFSPMHDHHATELMLRQSGLAWTSLRNGFYAASGLAFMGNALHTGQLQAPPDGKVSWTAHADLAEAAAIILASAGRFEGPTPPLTGHQALDLADLAHLASELLERPVTRTTSSDAELRARMTARNLPASVADIALGFYAASRKGEFAAVDPTLEQLLGRPPLGMRQLIASAIAQDATASANA
jgi:uncharacterized protein YbjT (DUF2867 family)